MHHRRSLDPLTSPRPLRLLKMIYNTKRRWDKQSERVNVWPKRVVSTRFATQDQRNCPGPLSTFLSFFLPCDSVSVCCFVLLSRYWGIVTVPGFPRVNRPQIITWGGWTLTLLLNYVAGYTGPLLFLFERTHNYYVDNQGLVPWRLRRLGRSKVRSASLVKVLSDGKISWISWSQGL